MTTATRRVPPLPRRVIGPPPERTVYASAQAAAEALGVSLKSIYRKLWRPWASGWHYGDRPRRPKSQLEPTL